MDLELASNIMYSLSESPPLHSDGENSLEPVDCLQDWLRYPEMVSQAESRKMFECIFNKMKVEKELIGKRPDAEYESLFCFIYNRPLYLKPSQSSLQTPNYTSDQNMMALIDFLITVVLQEPNSGLLPPITRILGVLEKKLRFFRDFLSNEHEIWEYLLNKIHNTVYGIALFVLIFCYKSDKLVSTAMLAIYLVCEIELLEQEIQDVYSERYLKSDDLKGSIEQAILDEIFGVVLRRNAIELLNSMSNLVHHPQILNIHGEVEHLKCFLEDLPKLDTRTQNLKHLLTQIGALNIKTRKVIHKLNVNGTIDAMKIIMDNELPSLMDKAKLIRAEIKKIPLLAQLSMPSHFPLTNGLGFIVSLLQKLSNQLNSKIYLVSTTKDNIKQIYEDLKKLSLFLGETSKKLTWHDFVDDLQTYIIEVAYKAECVVDSIDGDHFNLLPELYNVKEEAMLINEISEKIAKLHYEKKAGCDKKIARFHDNKVIQNIPASSEAYFMGNEEEASVGFEDEIRAITGQLTRGTLELDVISIVGMPGSGKTTLAQKVYNHKEITNHFDIQAWCTVSQNYNKEELLFEIYKQVFEQGITRKDNYYRDDQVAENLRKRLMVRRYLIVLDDVWDIDVWDGFYGLFSQSDEHGSRIILTTRLHEVASSAKRHSNPLDLRPLNHKESWELLVKKTFGNGNFPRELSDIGETILGICKGLPFKIAVVAGILSKLEPDAHQWSEFAKNLSSHITMDGESMKVVELSYNNLPDHLKPCFLYFGAFKEDEIVSVSRLVMLWIAEGFVQKSGQRSLEDLAKENLHALISRSLILVKRRRRWTREVKACAVHDLVREFCLMKAREENFLHMIREGDMNPLIFDHYRLSIDVEFNDYNQIMLSWLRGFCVRSFMWSSSSSSRYTKTIEPLWIFESFKLVRILVLSSVSVRYCYPELVSRLETLVHLRYLELRGSIYGFPCNLPNLETFWVKGTYVLPCITLPQSIWRMVNLRHVNVPLLDLANYGLKFFEGSSDLENVQSLATVELKYCKDDVNILKRFPNLRKLKCNIRVLWDDAEDCFLFPKLDFLHQLESLHMHNYAVPTFDRFKFYFPPNIRRLKLVNFWLPWREISVISALLNLEELVLQGALNDKKWDVEDNEFPNLKFLELWYLNIVEWVAFAESFPLLEELVIRQCYKLQEVPSCFGEIYTLRKIEISGCTSSAAESVIKIKDEIKDSLGVELDINI